MYPDDAMDTITELELRLQSAEARADELLHTKTLLIAELGRIASALGVKPDMQTVLDRIAKLREYEDQLYSVAVSRAETV